jgi:hypothetical protein
LFQVFVEDVIVYIHVRVCGSSIALHEIS